MTNPNLGLAWYRPEQWERLREISTDADKLEMTYAEWVRVAEDTLRRMRPAGLAPEKVDVDVEDLLRWCQARNKPVNGAARAEYVADWMSRRGSGTSQPTE